MERGRQPPPARPMTQSVVLAPGTGAATSADIVLGVEETVTLGIYVASGPIPAGVQVRLVLDTPGADITIATLSAATKAVLLNGPGTFRVLRGDIAAQGVAVGAFTVT